MKSVLTRARTDVIAMPRADGNFTQILGAKLRSLNLLFGAAARAHDRRRAYEAIGLDTMRDTGVPPETATGIQSWQAELPFFMQSGFGRR